MISYVRFGFSPHNNEKQKTLYTPSPSKTTMSTEINQYEKWISHGLKISYHNHRKRFSIYYNILVNIWINLTAVPKTIFNFGECEQKKKKKNLSSYTKSERILWTRNAYAYKSREARMLLKFFFVSLFLFFLLVSSFQLDFDFFPFL